LTLTPFFYHQDGFQPFFKKKGGGSIKLKPVLQAAAL